MPDALPVGQQVLILTLSSNFNFPLCVITDVGDTTGGTSAGAGDAGIAQDSATGAGDAGIAQDSATGAGNAGIAQGSSAGAGDAGIAQGSSAGAGNAGLAGDGGGGGDSPASDTDMTEVAAKRRRLTCSMESVEDQPEKMDDKNACSSTAGTSSLVDMTRRKLHSIEMQICAAVLRRNPDP